MKKFKGIIFDLDGVVVDSEPRHERAFREVFDEIGYGETHGVDFASYYGKSDRLLWIDFIARHRPAYSMDQLVDWKQRRFLEMLRREEPIFPSLPELVERLAAEYRLAIASGSYHVVIDAVLALRDLRRHFSAVVSSQDVAHGKPAPDIFIRAAELLGIRPFECCVIEDSSAGVEAAIAAGMEVIAITNSLPADQLSRATTVVSTYSEIKELLLG